VELHNNDNKGSNIRKERVKRKVVLFCFVDLYMTSELFLIFISKILLPFSLMIKTYISKLFSDLINSNI
jgi:hypothetical protein